MACKKYRKDAAVNKIALGGCDALIGWRVLIVLYDAWLWLGLSTGYSACAFWLQLVAAAASTL